MKDTSPYSPLKVFHHRPHIDALREGRHVPPIHVQVIPTNRCQQRCRGCSYRMPGYSSNETFNPKDEIPWEKLAEIIADCETMGVRAIELTGGGEPTVNPHFLDLCKLILDAGIDLGLVTNGGLWTAAHAEVLSKAKWVRFSVDAGSPETYAMYRRVPPEHFQKVHEAIRSLCMGVDRPLVGVGFVVTKDNWHEVLDAAVQARDDRADNFRISAIFQNEGARYFDSFGAQAENLCRQAEAMATDKFTVFDLFTDRVLDLRNGQPDYDYCGFQRLATYIGADLNVYRCCVYAYNHHGLLASLKEQSFMQAWFSQELRDRLDKFSARSCGICMMSNKNRIIEYAIARNPSHANFL